MGNTNYHLSDKVKVENAFTYTYDHQYSGSSSGAKEFSERQEENKRALMKQAGEIAQNLRKIELQHASRNQLGSKIIMGQLASRPDEASSSRTMEFTGRDGNTYAFGQDTIWVNGKVVEQKQFAQQFPEAASARMAQNHRHFMLTDQDTQRLRPEEGGHRPGPQGLRSVADVHSSYAEPFFFTQMRAGHNDIFQRESQGNLGAPNGQYNKKTKIVVEKDGQQQEVYSSNRQFSCSSTNPWTRKKLIDIQRNGHEAQLQVFLPAFQRAAEEAGGRAFVTKGK